MRTRSTRLNRPLNLKMAALELRHEIRRAKGCVECLQHETNVPKIDKLKCQMDSFADDREELNTLCEEISSVQAQRSTYKLLFEELRNSTDIVEELCSQQQDSSAKLDYGVSKQKALFEKCLGLRFKLTEDKAITFEFQHLNSAHPDSCCSITLDINSVGQWEVIDIKPSISGVQALLNCLNKSSNLKEFCKALRTKFKQHLSTEVANTQSQSSVIAS